MRKKIFGSLHHEQFRHRGEEILRIEALSDAVFAFSVSLLVAALEVPQTFDELLVILKGAIPFFATVSLVFVFWYQQYKFFRHYGLNDIKIIVLNLVYLTLILFYIYPLKFLFSVLLSAYTGIDLFPKATEKGLPVLANADFPQLIGIFSVGYLLIWMLLFLMHAIALRSAKELELNAYETAYTIKETRGALWNAMIGLVAIIFLFTGLTWLPGLCYLSIPLLLYLNEALFRRRLKMIKA